MATRTLNPKRLAQGYSREQQQPLGGYVALIAAFLSAATAFSACCVARTRSCPRRLRRAIWR
jgi:hypothetical protein